MFCYHIEPGDTFNHPGVVHLFGRHGDRRWRVDVHSVQRELYFLPRVEATPEEVRLEILELCDRKRINNPIVSVVKRNYCYFRELDVCPPDLTELQQTYVKLEYSFAASAFARSTTGTTFRRVFGTTLTLLETFIIMQRIKGPSWLTFDHVTKLEPRGATGCFQVPSPACVRVDAVQKAVPTLLFASVAFSPAPTTVISLLAASGDQFGFVLSAHPETVDDAKRNIVGCRDESALWGRFSQQLDLLDPDIIVVYAISKARRSKLATQGRLICDLRTSADEFIGTGKTSFPELVRSQLHQTYVTIEETNLSPVDYFASEAFFILRLMHLLGVIPLSIQLTKLCGNLLSQSLRSFRAKRVEFLLMHEFHDRDYLIPDRLNPEELGNTETFEGGLVLSPKAGIYNVCVLLLDYRSLYPSLVQEHGLCFTEAATLLSSVFSILLAQRRAVKVQLAAADGADEGLQIQQKALKLVANSIYGCLGFQSNLFYFRALAECIAKNGREHLERALKAAKTLGFDVIYGDTDSIMVNTHTRDVDKATRIAEQIRAAVNVGFTHMELELDAIFLDILLLEQKKR